MLDRRTFIGGAVAAAALPGFAAGKGERIRKVASDPEIGKTLRKWKPGELDIHFLSFGMGETGFYILPDGTTWLNDCGEYSFQPDQCPPRPSNRFCNGEWTCRYLSQILDKKELDYLTISHWHTDHAGSPSRLYKTKDGRGVNGSALVADKFRVRHYFDFEYPDFRLYVGGDKTAETMREYVKYAVEHEGLSVEPFRVGALDQICLRHDESKKYGKLFHVRNICANGKVWTGKDESFVDYGPSTVKAQGGKRNIDVNILSMGVRIDYGRFSYFSGGDVSKWLKDENGKTVDYEATVGERCGPVTVCKTNHHGYVDAMREPFVKAVRPAAYLSNVWYFKQIQDANMRFMSSRELYPGDRFFFATCIPPKSRELNAGKDWWRDFAPPGHIVVRVAPGGGAYRIYVLDNTDEERRVVAVYEGEA